MKIKTFLIAILTATLFTFISRFVDFGNPLLLFLCFFCNALLVALAISLLAAPGRAAGSQSRARDGNREQGTVKWFNAKKGFGFITRDSGQDIFVHFREIDEQGHKILRDGQRVEFTVAESDKGLQAEAVVKLG